MGTMRTSPIRVHRFLTWTVHVGITVRSIGIVVETLNMNTMSLPKIAVDTLVPHVVLDGKVVILDVGILHVWVLHVAIHGFPTVAIRATTPLKGVDKIKGRKQQSAFAPLSNLLPYLTSCTCMHKRCTSPKKWMHGHWGTIVRSQCDYDSGYVEATNNIASELVSSAFTLYRSGEDFNKGNRLLVNLIQQKVLLSSKDLSKTHYLLLFQRNQVLFHLQSINVPRRKACSIRENDISYFGLQGGTPPTQPNRTFWRSGLAFTYYGRVLTGHLGCRILRWFSSSKVIPSIGILDFKTAMGKTNSNTRVNMEDMTSISQHRYCWTMYCLLLHWNVWTILFYRVRFGCGGQWWPITGVVSANAVASSSMFMSTPCKLLIIRCYKIMCHKSTIYLWFSGNGQGGNDSEVTDENGACL